MIILYIPQEMIMNGHLLKVITKILKNSLIISIRKMVLQICINKYNIQFLLYNTQQIHFSTPHQYLKRLNQQNLQYSVKFDDFFPYSDNHQSYWTGYYTSRISFKGYVRQLSKEFQQIKTFLSKQISYDNIKDEDELLQLLSNHNQNMGIVQHHDAITGTAKQFVNDDYIKLLQQSSTLLDQYMRKHVSILTEQLLEYKNYEYHTCYYNKTISECKQLDVWLNQNKTVLLALLMNQNRIIKLLSIFHIIILKYIFNNTSSQSSLYSLR